MEVYCPACGRKGRIEDAKVPESGIFARCPGCKKRLWINKVDGVSLAEESSAKAPPQSGRPSDRPAAGFTTPPAKAATESPAGPSGLVPTPPSIPDPPSSPAPASATMPLGPEQQPGETAPAQSVPVSAKGFEISPISTAQAQPVMESPSAEPPESGILCDICSGTFPESEMVKFGDTMVCAGCKPEYVQMIKSGVARPSHFRYGGFWIRFVAKFIDGIVLAIAQGILIVPLYIFVFKSASVKPGAEMVATFATANIFINAISIALGATYTTFFIGKYQATPGKMAFGLKVVSPDGDRISYLRALGRHFAEMVSAFILLIGYIMAGFDSQKRSLHDRICATRVIRT